MREVACFKIVVSGFVDRCLPPFSERELAGYYISNPRSDVVMHSKVGSWLEREFGGSYFEFAVQLSRWPKRTSSSLITDVMPRTSTFS